MQSDGRGYAGAVTCDYDEEGMDPVANFSGMDPEGENIVWSLAGADASYFEIPGGVLSFKKPPSYEDQARVPEGETAPDNSYDGNGGRHGGARAGFPRFGAIQ